MYSTAQNQELYLPGSLPGQRTVRDIDRGPHYPRASELEVLQDEAGSIRVYDEGNIRRCIRELLTSDPVSHKIVAEVLSACLREP